MAAERVTGEPDDSAVSQDVVLDVATLYAEGLRLLPGLWRQAETQGKNPAGLVLDLRDSTGKVILSIPFTDLHVADRH